MKENDSYPVRGPGDMGDLVMGCLACDFPDDDAPMWVALEPGTCASCRERISAAQRKKAFAGSPPRGVPERQRMARSSELQDELKGVRSAYLYGDVGVGKSYQAVAMLKSWWLAKFEAGGVLDYRWWQAARLAEAMRDSVKLGTSKQLTDDLIGCEALVIDDLGSERITEFAKEQLLIVIGERYDEKRDMIFTSNLSLGKLAARLSSEDVDDPTGDRIASRIAESCDIVEMRGLDRRLM